MTEVDFVVTVDEEIVAVFVVDADVVAVMDAAVVEDVEEERQLVMLKRRRQRVVMKPRSLLEVAASHESDLMMIFLQMSRIR